MKCRVEFSEAAAIDLEPLFDFALQREREGAAGDLDIPDRIVQAIKETVAFRESFPVACRKAANYLFLRELVIPFGRTGHVALFEVVDGNTVIIGAVRHQREDDCH